MVVQSRELSGADIDRITPSTQRLLEHYQRPAPQQQAATFLRSPAKFPPPFLICAPQNRKVVAVSRAFAGSARTLNGYPAGMLLPEAGHPMEGEVVGVVMVASTTQAVVKGRSGDGNDVVAFKLPVDVLKAVVEGVRM